jgi:hypothetical protein
MHTEDPATGQRRACTGIVLSPVRTLATPDCFLGRGDDDWTSSSPTTSTNHPYYRSHPQYDSVT